MMGYKERTFAPLAGLSLDDLAPADDFSRRLNRCLALGFVRDLVRDASAQGGRPSIDPIVFFKLQLILFFEGLRSERRLMRVVADRLSLRWYVGDDLAEPLPDHSGLTRIRDHYVVDGGKRRIILAALVSPADVMENQPMLDLLWHVCFRWKLRPGQVTGDTTYGTLENVVAVEEAGIRAYLPLADFDHRTPFFGKDAFVYDAAADAYRCPGGATLGLRKQKHTERERVYQAPAATCNACPLKPRCTPSAKGRQVTRSFDEAYLDRVRGYHATEAYRKALRKREVWVEPLFAEAKTWHGLGRFRLRGLPKVNIEAQLVAAGQNLKRLLSGLGWGRRPWPTGAAGLVLPPAPPAPDALQ